MQNDSQRQLANPGLSRIMTAKTVRLCVSIKSNRFTTIMKKRSEETQTLNAGYSKVEPKFFRHATDPLPGGTGRPQFNQLWSLPLPTDPVWWGSMHAILSYRGNRPTHTHSHPHTNRKDRLQYTTPQIACSVKKIAAATATTILGFCSTGLNFWKSQCQSIEGYNTNLKQTSKFCTFLTTNKTSIHLQ